MQQIALENSGCDFPGSHLLNYWMFYFKYSNHTSVLLISSLTNNVEVAPGIFVFSRTKFTSCFLILGSSLYWDKCLFKELNKLKPLCQFISNLSLMYLDPDHLHTNAEFNPTVHFNIFVQVSFIYPQKWDGFSCLGQQFNPIDFPDLQLFWQFNFSCLNFIPCLPLSNLKIELKFEHSALLNFSYKKAFQISK